MKEIIKAYNMIIAECNDGKSVAFTNCIIRENRIEDYYDGTCSTEEYLKKILDDVKSNSYDDSNKLLHNFYENDNSDFKPMKDNIRRLFMLYAFGSKEQIEYFENECKKEFWKMK